MDEIKVIGFDADDTLWVNMPFFTETEKQFCALLSEYADADIVSQEQYRTETANMPLYGFGTKSFTLSMVETAQRLSGGRIAGTAVTDIIELGRRLLDHPMQVLDGVEEVLAALGGRFLLVTATKGDLLEQERKLEKSGLKGYFHHIEIMSDKRPEDYARMLERLGIAPEEFLMVGNSVKSDIMPVLSLGAHAVHVPFHDTWIHERAEPPTGHVRFHGIDSLRRLPDLPLLAIRKGAPGDIPALVALWRRSVEATHAFLTGGDIDLLEPQVRDGLAQMELWVADAGDGPAGFMGMDGNLIEALFIDPDRMGRRLGSGFIHHARKLRGDGVELRVDVNEDNPDALAFYLARGFKQVGRSDTDSAGRPWPILHLALQPGY